jgi:hypothetical protein
VLRQHSVARRGVGSVGRSHERVANTRSTAVQLEREQVSEWLTYAQGAARFGISAEAFRQLAMRRKWQRRRSNDDPHGAALVLIPDDIDVRARTPVERADEHLLDARPLEGSADIPRVMAALETTIAALTVRAERAEAEADRLIATVQVERGRSDRAEAATAAERAAREQAEARADQAEASIATERAARARVETEAAQLRLADQERRRRGLVARLRQALRGD